MIDGKLNDQVVLSACDELQRAVVMARAGLHRQAHELIDRVRSTKLNLLDVRVTIWMMLVEGLLAHFESADPASRDRLMRALALSEAAGMNELIARSSAWAAQMEFEAGCFEKAVDLVNRCLMLGDQAPLDAKVRAYMVAAACLSCAALDDQADVYYRKARLLAIDIGDRASIGAVLFNQAALKINSVRLALVMERMSVHDAVHTSATLSSSVNFDNLVGAGSLIAVSRVLYAKTFLIQGRYRAALNLLIAQYGEFSDKVVLKARSAIAVDLAWCHCELGDLGAAVDLLKNSNEIQIDKLDLDDRIVYYAILERVESRMGNHESSALSLEEKCRAIVEYDLKISRLRSISEKVFSV